MIELISYWGNDLMVVNAARVSYGKNKDILDEKDIKLLSFLADKHHIAPFYPNFRTKRYTLCTRYSAYFYRAVYRVCSASSTLFYCEQ